jgi:sugar/nucleoside kinase (ribokinase family)
MRIAKKSGSILSYDPNLRLALWPSAEAAREGIMSIWDQADVIKVWLKLKNYGIYTSLHEQKIPAQICYLEAKQLQAFH